MTDSDRSDCNHVWTVLNKHWYCKDCDETLAGEQHAAVPIEPLQELIKAWRKDAQYRLHPGEEATILEKGDELQEVIEQYE